MTSSLINFYTYMAKQKQVEERMTLLSNRFGNIVGEKHGWLKIIKIIEACPNGRGAKVDCLCDCGNLKVTYLSYLRSKSVKSCGCKPCVPTPFAVRQ